ncbi:hypothetical protein GU926_11800 [Nibribacter ruber]|uniref:Uncharacterized protein n=1 Tax=Nibribacter ruber TaxID=2698458 RepID=A0A6P1NWK3_9BACT|nr:hypothetical protein [Nibribacter ruber]QHL88077.1 hypothetical protein GU926_11800 [Nibribacter ruber]
MRKVTLLFGLSVCLLSVSCQDQPVPRAARSTHQAFDLVGFLDQEAKSLEQAHAQVKKTVLEDGQVMETKTMQDIEWAQELGTFSEADLNKPALLGLFDVQKTTNAQGQQVYQFTAKEDTDAMVQKATYTLDGQGRLVQLEATLLQKNFLFTTHKQLTLHAQPGTHPQLQSYSLDESQTLLFSNTERYGVKGEVVR